VLIANDDEEFFSELDERVASRFKISTRIRFTPYTEQELVSILEDRVRWGLSKNTVDAVQLEMIAESASGDARVAIGILRVAARRAQSEGRSHLTDDLILSAVSEAKSEVQQKTLEKLTTDQKLLYEIIAEHGELAPGELYQQYREQASNPRSDRMVRNYLAKLCHYNLIEALGENRGRRYRVVSEEQ
jgi:Cdc6-like AAA superfamily ATPase